MLVNGVMEEIVKVRECCLSCTYDEGVWHRLLQSKLKGATDQRQVNRAKRSVFNRLLCQTERRIIDPLCTAIQITHELVILSPMYDGVLIAVRDGVTPDRVMIVVRGVVQVWNDWCLEHMGRTFEITQQWSLKAYFPWHAVSCSQAAAYMTESDHEGATLHASTGQSDTCGGGADSAQSIQCSSEAEQW